ncbi:MAG: type II toxin-antitoxin system MqsR family toxin [Alphaproteobacteria bacterium]|nr:type II toxin-antitoxin system MqsR family toxin [Alphaproteobacteria bacterium]
MEKRRPTFRLDRFREVCGDPRRLAVTRSALSDALSSGFAREDMAAVVRSIKPSQFYKSMTSFADSHRWQDVYHVPWNGMVLYIKFTDDTLTEFTVLSFKER